MFNINAIGQAIAGKQILPFGDNHAHQHVD